MFGFLDFSFIFVLIANVLLSSSGSQDQAQDVPALDWSSVSKKVCSFADSNAKQPEKSLVENINKCDTFDPNYKLSVS